MSNCTIPNWNLRLQRQEQEEAEEGINRSSHVHSQQNPSFVVPMSKYEVKELTWENGLPDMHGLGGIIRFPTATTKPTWDDKASDTLESIVHQAATSHKQSSNLVQLDHQNEKPNGSSMQLATGKLGESTTGHKQMAAADHHHAADHLLLKKRVRSEHSNQCGRYFSTQERAERSAYASASATFCRDHDDTTKMTNWPSSESLRSVKTKTTDDDSASHGGSENRNEENQTKGETVRSVLTRNGRAAAIHNQSERRRRDRINQKMKALQKLVPNASKTDKASMLDEVIEYLKKLQAQVHMMSVRSMSQMMMPLGMHQQLQMSLLARMGMGVGLGMGMGMFDMNNIARSATHQPFPSLVHPGAAMTGAAPTFLPPPFIMPPAVPTRPPLQSNIGATTNNSVPYNDPYSAFLAHQSMNIDLYNKMAEIFRQQANQSQQTSGSSPQENLAQKG